MVSYTKMVIIDFHELVTTTFKSYGTEMLEASQIYEWPVNEMHPVSWSSRRHIPMQ